MKTIEASATVDGRALGEQPISPVDGTTVERFDFDDLVFGPGASISVTPLTLPATPGPDVIDIHQTAADSKSLDLHRIEDRLLERAVDVIDGAMRFADLTAEDIGENSPPPNWIGELGAERAARVFNAAKGGLQNAKDAPVGIKVAEGVAKSIIKARSMERAAPSTLNVAVIQQVNYTYNTVEIEDGS